MGCDCQKALGCGHYCKAGNWKQFFAQVSPGLDGFISRPWYVPGQNEPLIARNARSDSGDGRSCSWFYVTLHARSLYRSQIEAEIFQPVSPDRLSTLPTTGSSLIAKLTLGDNTRTQRVLFVDVGAGWTFSWYGTGVQIDIVTNPLGTFTLDGARSSIVDQGNADTIEYGGTIVEDSIIEANAVLVDGAHSHLGDPLTLTEVLRPTAIGETLIARRPPGARRAALISQSASSDVQWVVNSPGQSLVAWAGVGSSWNTGNLQTPIGSTPVEVPGPASALAWVADDFAPYTVIWEVLP